jgi:DNA polymerase-3 subunit delta
MFFFCGQDTYRLKEEIDSIIRKEKEKNKNFLEIEKFNFDDDFKLEQIENIFSQNNIFKNKKLVIFNGFLKNKDFIDNILTPFLKKTKENKDTFIFVEDCETFDKLSPEIKKLFKLKKFDFLKGQQLKKWIENEFLKYGFKVKDVVVLKLIYYIGSDSWRLSNEIKKLISYSLNKEINEKDIDLFVKPKTEINIFKFIDSLAQRNKKLALNLLKKQLKEKSDPAYILSMINYQFRNLILVKETNGIGLNLKPFFIRKLLFLSKKFTMPELKRIYQKIFEADFKLKTGVLEPDLVLDFLLAEI